MEQSVRVTFEVVAPVMWLTLQLVEMALAPTSTGRKLQFLLFAMLM